MNFRKRNKPILSKRGMDKLIPRILVACPTSSRHAHLLDDWINHLNDLTYPNFEVLLVDNTPDNKEYFNLLKTKKVNGKSLNLIRMPFNSKKNHILQHLALVRDEIRKYFLDNNFDNLFLLDSDIFVPKNSIQKLVSRNKDLVGFLVHIYDKMHRKPCVFKSGEFVVIGKPGLDLFSFSEINAYKRFVAKYKKNKLSKEEKLLKDIVIKDKWRPDLLKVYGSGIGCLMIKKKVLEEVPFRAHPRLIIGEDIWFINECNDKKFEFWTDVSVRAKHRNTNWSMITDKASGINKFYIAIGPVQAKQAVFLENKNKKTKRIIIDKNV